MKNRQIAPDTKTNLIGARLLTQARIFYSDWYYKSYTEYEGNFNEDISYKINRINKYLSELPIIVNVDKEKGNNKDLDFDKIEKEKLLEIISEFPSSITYIVTHMSRIDRLEFKSRKIDNGDFGYSYNLNVAFWGLLLIRQFMENEGMDSGDINSFIYQYNGIRARKKLYPIY